MEDTPQNVASRGRVPLHVDEQGNSSQDPEFPEVGSPRSDPPTSDSGESDVDTVEKAGTRNQARAGSSTMDQDKDKDKKEESTARNQARRERTQHGSSATGEKAATKVTTDMHNMLQHFASTMQQSMTIMMQNFHTQQQTNMQEQREFQRQQQLEQQQLRFDLKQQQRDNQKLIESLEAKLFSVQEQNASLMQAQQELQKRIGVKSMHAPSLGISPEGKQTACVSLKHSPVHASSSPTPQDAIVPLVKLPPRTEQQPDSLATGLRDIKNELNKMKDSPFMDSKIFPNENHVAQIKSRAVTGGLNSSSIPSLENPTAHLPRLDIPSKRAKAGSMGDPLPSQGFSVDKGRVGGRSNLVSKSRSHKTNIRPNKIPISKISEIPHYDSDSISPVPASKQQVQSVQTRVKNILPETNVMIDNSQNTMPHSSHAHTYSNIQFSSIAGGDDGDDGDSSSPDSTETSSHTVCSDSDGLSISRKRRQRKHKHRMRQNSIDAFGIKGMHMREKDMAAVAKAMQLTGEESALLYLRKFRRHATKHNWNNQLIISYLVPLYRPKKFSQMEEVDEWYSCLSKTTKNSLPLLQQSFLRNFGKQELERFIQETEETRQKSGEKCLEFLRRVWRHRTYLKEWSPNDLKSRKYFLKRLAKRFTNPTMKLKIAEIAANPDGDGNPRPISYKQYVSMCSIADLDAEYKHGSSSKSMGADTIPTISVESISQEVHGVTCKESTSDSDMDDTNFQLHRCYAAQMLREEGHVPNARDVRKLATTWEKKGRQVPYVEEQSLDSVIRNGWKCIFGHGDTKEVQPCPFYCLQGNCTNVRCRYSHKWRRKSTYCANKMKNNCKLGYKCLERHPGDVYSIWFRRKKSNLYRRYVWKDLVSSFSIYKNS